MRITKSRNMFNLHWKKALILPILLCLFQFVNAQKARGNYNFLDFQSKPYYFGITLAYNTANFRVYRSDDFILNDSISSVQDVNGPGFNLGIVTNLKVGDYFDFRFLPTLSFAERNIRYKTTRFFSTTPSNGTDGGVSTTSLQAVTRTRKIEQVLVEMPFHIRYKSAPFKDMRLFVIAGVKYSFDVASDSRTRQADELVKISPTDFQVETGAGIQFFFPYFIFSPEFKMSNGISNTLLYDNALDESTVLEKVLSRTFTISLHFEG